MCPHSHPPALRALAAHMRARPAAILRAPRADLEPRQMLAELVASFDTFKANQDKRDKNVQTAIDDMNAKLAAAKLGGGLVDQIDAVDPEYTTLFASYARAGRGAHDLQEANAKGERLRINAAMSSGAGEAGGYLVPIEWNRQILKAQRSVSPFRQIANVIETTVRGYSTIWNGGGWGTGWVGETASRPETTTATLKPITFTHGEIFAYPMVTQQLLDDADFPFEEWLGQELGEEFARQEGIAFLSGTGTNMPAGLLTYVTGGTNAATHPGGAIPIVVSGSAAAMTTDSLINLVFAVPAPYRQNGRFLMNSLTLASVAKFKDAGGNYIWQPSYAQGVPPTLLGYPVTIDEGMPDVAANSLPIAFGDFKRGYVINDRMGVRTLRDPYTAKPYVGFYTTKRVGGGVADPTAIRVLKVAAS